MPFCDAELSPGSEEHLFLSALGARTSTRHATCSACNNAFASKQTGKVDDALADVFMQLRNALKIWSGRGEPPPTWKNAGKFEDGVAFDMAPGLTPIAKPGQLPANLASGAEYIVPARDAADVSRLLDIMTRRGFDARVQSTVRVQLSRTASKAPFHDRRIGASC